MIEKYVHHRNEVYVKKNLKGKHRDHCLCWECKRFDIDNRYTNCHIANLVYALCVAEKLVLPVWECPRFKNKEVEKYEK